MGYAVKKIISVGFACVLAAVLGTVNVAHAALIASDNFDYSNGALANQNGGAGWSGAWHGSGSVALADGQQAVLQDANIFRTLATPISVEAGNKVYVGLDVGASGAIKNSFAGFSFFSAGQEVLFIGGNDFYSINVAGRYLGKATAPLSLPVSYLLAEIIFNAANKFTVNLFVNPTGASGQADVTYTGTFLGGATWDSVRLAAGEYDAVITTSPMGVFDNLVIGSELSDVMRVPEPSGIAILAASLLGLLLVRVRRRQTT